MSSINNMCSMKTTKKTSVEHLLLISTVHLRKLALPVMMRQLPRNGRLSRPNTKSIIKTSHVGMEVQTWEVGVEREVGMEPHPAPHPPSLKMQA